MIRLELDRVLALLNSIFYSLHEQEQTHLCDDLSQARIAHDQPAPGCDAIGLVLKLLRVDIIEILEPDEERSNNHTHEKKEGMF